MSNIWNDLNCKRPAMLTYASSSQQYKEYEKVFHVLNQAKLFYQNQKPFHDSIAMCLQLIYIRNSQFRTQRGFQNLRKIKTAYMRFRAINIEEIITTFAGSLSRDYDIMHLPTRQTFEYLLVKMQGFAKLICRIVVCSKAATIEFMGLLSLGFFIELNTLLLGVLSEIWNSAREMCRQTVGFYNMIRPYHEKFKNAKKSWLPDNYMLPKELGDWIGFDWEAEIKESGKKDSEKSKVFNLSDENDNASAVVLSESSIVHHRAEPVNKLLLNSNDMGAEVSISELMDCERISTPEEEGPSRKKQKKKNKNKSKVKI